MRKRRFGLGGDDRYRLCNKHLTQHNSHTAVSFDLILDERETMVGLWVDPDCHIWTDEQGSYGLDQIAVEASIALSLCFCYFIYNCQT